MSIERDVLGFVEERCQHCNAHLFVADSDAAEDKYKPICLNACLLPTWQHREMQKGLVDSYSKSACTEEGRV